MEMDHVKDMRVKGAGKFFYGLVMLITYPLRHFFKFIGFILVSTVFLAAVPMSQGVSYRHVLDWYLLRYQDAEDKLSGQIKVFELDVPADDNPARFKEVSAPKIIRKAQHKSPDDVRRRVFKRPPIKLPQEDIPQASSGLVASNTVMPVKKSRVIEPEKPLPTIRQDQSETEMPAPTIQYRKDLSLDLMYEETPKEVIGKTYVFNAGEMAVGDAYIILYGIDIKKENDAKGFLYLKELADGKELSCMIVAYTKENIPTGICFLDGRSINRNMVDAGFADNIAL